MPLAPPVVTPPATWNLTIRGTTPVPPTVADGFGNQIDQTKFVAIPGLICSNTIATVRFFDLSRINSTTTAGLFDQWSVVDSSTISGWPTGNPGLAIHNLQKDVYLVWPPAGDGVIVVDLAGVQSGAHYVSWTFQLNDPFNKGGCGFSITDLKNKSSTPGQTRFLSRIPTSTTDAIFLVPSFPAQMFPVNDLADEPGLAVLFYWPLMYTQLSNTQFLNYEVGLLPGVIAGLGTVPNGLNVPIPTANQLDGAVVSFFYLNNGHVPNYGSKCQDNGQQVLGGRFSELGGGAPDPNGSSVLNNDPKLGMFLIQKSPTDPTRFNMLPYSTSDTETIQFNDGANVFTRSLTADPSNSSTWFTYDDQGTPSSALTFKGSTYFLIHSAFNSLGDNAGATMYADVNGISGNTPCGEISTFFPPVQHWVTPNTYLRVNRYSGQGGAAVGTEADRRIRIMVHKASPYMRALLYFAQNPSRCCVKDDTGLLPDPDARNQFFIPLCTNYSMYNTNIGKLSTAQCDLFMCGTCNVVQGLTSGYCFDATNKLTNACNCLNRDNIDPAALAIPSLAAFNHCFNGKCVSTSNSYKTTNMESNPCTQNICLQLQEATGKNWAFNLNTQTCTINGTPGPSPGPGPGPGPSPPGPPGPPGQSFFILGIALAVAGGVLLLILLIVILVSFLRNRRRRR